MHAKKSELGSKPKHTHKQHPTLASDHSCQQPIQALLPDSVRFSLKRKWRSLVTIPTYRIGKIAPLRDAGATGLSRWHLLIPATKTKVKGRGPKVHKHVSQKQCDDANTWLVYGTMFPERLSHSRILLHPNPISSDLAPLWLWWVISGPIVQSATPLLQRGLVNMSCGRPVYPRSPPQLIQDMV
jgi:hypothetical protein